MGLHVGIVGGSIAGCLAALELARDGHRVEVFERAPGEARGAGIGFLPVIWQRLVDRNYVPEALPRLRVEQQVFAAKSSSDARLGKIALRAPGEAWALHWSDLHRALQARLPEGSYQSGVDVSGARTDGSRATLELADGSERSFDLALFADGYRSRGRALICPHGTRTYRGYTLWRGVVPAAELGDVAPLMAASWRLGHPGSRGHTVMYVIPDGRGGGQCVNFGSYLPLAAAELAPFLVDRDGRQHRGSMPPGQMRPDEEVRLKAQLASRLPSYFAAVVERSRDTFAQPIFTASVPRYRSGRLCLVGDAGALVQPLTGSGVMKALDNARGLASALRRNADVEQALAAWDAQATAAGAMLLRLGDQMEQALIWHPPDFAQLGGEATRSWWDATTRLPE